MFTAVDGNKRAVEKGDFVMSLFIVVLPVMVFILCGLITVSQILVTSL